MILDRLLQFTGNGSTAPSNNDNVNDIITTALTNAQSSGAIDLAITQPALPPSQTSPTTQPFRDIGIGDDPAMKLLVMLNSTPAGGTSLQVGISGAPDNGSGGQGTYTVWYTSPVYSLANLNAGNQGLRLLDMDMPRPSANAPEPRFVALNYTSVGTFTGTSLLLRGYLVLDRFDQVYNASVNNISGGYAPGITIPN